MSSSHRMFATICFKCRQRNCTKDVTKQAVVATHISRDGMPSETLLGVPQIKKGDAAATVANFFG